MRRPELWRTTTFRLTLLYGAVFAAGVVALLGLIYVSAAIYLTHQMDEIVVGQAQALEVASPADLPEKLREVETQDVRSVYFYGLFRPDGSLDRRQRPRSLAGERAAGRRSRANCASRACSRAPAPWPSAYRPARSCLSASTPRC